MNPVKGKQFHLKRDPSRICASARGRASSTGATTIIPARQIIFDIVETLPKQLRRERQLTNRWSAAKHEFFSCNKLAHNDGSAPRDVLRGGRSHPRKNSVNRLLTDRWIAQNICRACQTFVENDESTRQIRLPRIHRIIFRGQACWGQFWISFFLSLVFLILLFLFSFFFLSGYSKWYIERFSVWSVRGKDTIVVHACSCWDAYFLRDEEEVEIFLYSFEMFNKIIYNIVRLNC